MTHGLLDLLPAAYWRQDRISAEAPGAGALVNNAATAAFAGAFLGCLATLHFSAGGFVPAIASALATTLLCGPLLITRTTSLFSGEMFAAIYGGTFVGMTPALGFGDNAAGAPVMPASAIFILLSIVSGLAFCIVAEIDARSGRRLAGGCGGRSGAIATVASFLFVEAAALFGSEGHAFRAAHADMLDAEPRALALACGASMIGMFATLAVLRRGTIASAQPAERIFVAAAVALIGLMLLHLNAAGEPRILDAFYAGCFLGMSTPERLQGWIRPVLAVMLLNAMLVLVKALMPEVGGELGLAAFVTVAVMLAPGRLTRWLTADNSTRGKLPRTTTAASGRRIADMPGRSAITTAGTLAAILVVGCLVLPGEVASEVPIDDTGAPATVAEQSVRAPLQVALAQATADSVDEASPIGAPAVTLSADAINADAGLSLELNVTDVAAEHGGVAAADARAELAPVAPMEGAAPAEAVQDGTSVDDGAMANADVFREFMQWRAARYGAMAHHPRSQPVKRTRNPALQMVRLTPPAPIRTAPRAPTRTPPIRHVPGQSVP